MKRVVGDSKTLKFEAFRRSGFAIEMTKKSDDSSVQQALHLILVFGQLKFNKIVQTVHYIQ